MRFSIVLTVLVLLAACSKPEATGAKALSDAFSFEPELIATDGSAVTPARFQGRRSIVYFGFANCPDVCPTAIARLTAALDILDGRPAYDAYFITVDPERDTVEALQDYLAFDDRLTGVSGEPEKVRAVLDAMHVYAKREELPDSAIGYTMAHSSLFYVIDGTGTPTYAISDAVTPDELAQTLRALAK